MKPSAGSAGCTPGERRAGAGRQGKAVGDPDEWIAALTIALLTAGGSREPLRLLRHHSAVQLCRASPSTLRRWCEEERAEAEVGSGCGPSWIGRFAAARSALDREEISAAVEGAGLCFVPLSDPCYPPALRQLEFPPAGLFVKGNPDVMRVVLEAPVVTIVGTRRATPYGLAVTAMLTRAFTGAGITVVSGLAYGVDAQAHRVCLASSGATVAVLGTRADAPYPRRHAELYDNICRAGAVISEVPPGAPAFKWRFPLRNRLMAALGDAVVVTEAGDRSGALNTAGWALDLGRPVFAVPGPITGQSSRGTNRMLADGAFACLDAQEAVEDFLASTRLERLCRGARTSAGSAEGRRGAGAAGGAWPEVEDSDVQPTRDLVMLGLGRGPGTVDEVARATGLTVREVAIALAYLESTSRVVRLGQGRYAMV